MFWYNLSHFFNPRTFGTTTSLASQERNRLLTSFESIVNAKERSANQKLEVNSGKRKIKDHVGELGNYVFDTKACIDKVFNIYIYICIYFYTKMLVLFCVCRNYIYGLDLFEENCIAICMIILD